MHRDALILLGFLSILGFGCRLAPRGVWVNTGQKLLPGTDLALRDGGAFLSSYDGLADLEAGELGESDPECEEAGNVGVQEVLQTRYSLQKASAPWNSGESLPPEGPEYLIVVQSVRCQAITAGSANARVSYSLRGGEREARGEVVLAIYKRSQKEPIIEILGRETAKSGKVAAYEAGKRAAERLFLGVP